MKRCAAMSMCGAMVVLAMLAVAGVAQADFLISLRSGTEIKVSRYQEEGNQIAYRRFGGKVAISKARVATIENLETGEKRVFNRLLSAQELEAQRKAVDARMRRQVRRQNARLRSNKRYIVWNSLADAYVGVRRMKIGEPVEHLIACKPTPSEFMRLANPSESEAVKLLYKREYTEIEIVEGPNAGCRGVTSLYELSHPE